MKLPGWGVPRFVIAVVVVGALAAAPALVSAWNPLEEGRWASPATATASGSWGPNVKINNEQTGSVQQVPGLVIDGTGLVYSAWAEDSGGGKNLYSSKSTDWGKSWVRGGRINDQADKAGAGMQRQARLAIAPNGDLYAAWHYWPGAGQDTFLYVSKSTDGGAAWLAPVVLDMRGDMANVVTTSDGKVHAFHLYGKNSVGSGPHYRVSTDSGATFSASKNISTSADTDGCECCHITPLVGQNDEIYLSWRAGSTSDKRVAYITSSMDKGATWRTPSMVSDWEWPTSVCPMSGPEMALDAQGTLHLVFMDPRSGSKDIFYYRSSDKGVTWTSAVRVNSQASGDQDQPAIAVVGSEIVVAWMQNDAIWWSSSGDGGATWSAQARLEDNPAGAHQYPVAASLPGASAAVFAWSDSRSGSLDAYAATYYGASDTQAPTVSITSPQNGASLGGTVNVDVDAQDNVAVAKVEFHLDGSKASEDASAPYRWTWDTTTAADGAHKLKAVAFDAAGNSAPNEIDVTVSNQGQDKTPPTVSLTSPTNGATVNGMVTIAADATDNKAVASVEFFVDGASILKDTSAPYQAQWDTTQAAQGSHTLKATAADTSANTADSTITVTVDNAAKDSLPPVVAITSPADGATVSATVTIKADITDNVKVKDAALYVDGSAVGGMQTAAPWEWTVDSASYANGDHSIEVKASDDAANIGSKKIVVKFSNTVLDAPPTVSLMEPKDGDTVSGSVKVHAMASDDRGLEHVEFKLDGKVMFRDASSSYEWIFETTAAANGPHEIVAEAKDSAGQVASAKITVTVSNAGGGGGGATGGDFLSNPLYLGLIIGLIAAVAVGAAVAMAARSKRKREPEQQAMLMGQQGGGWS
jgi:hypothetical protein